MLKNTRRGLAARIDWGSLGGLLLAFGGILGGLVSEGGRLHDVAQITAAAIVLGGTAGAVLISKPWGVVKTALGRIREILVAPREMDTRELMDYLIDLARRVRRSGIGSLEDQARSTPDHFLSKALGIAADGLDSRELRQIMELEIRAEQREFEEDAAVFEAAGGYSPTIGIIGAVLGLIQVMKHLDHLEEVGRGIAVAFVATVYGVALANVVFLPFAAKILARGKKLTEQRELILVGVLAIGAGTNPRLIQLQLESFLEHGARRVALAPGAPPPGKVAQIG